MAGFKTHITTSSVIGVGYAVGGFVAYGIPAETSVLAGGLCGIAGMLPDLDSGPGRPLRESMAFAAAVVPMAMVDRFRAWGMTLETIILAGGAIYLFIRFGLAWALRKYTVHRGMFHSLPAALIAGEVTFLVFGCERLELRYYVAGAVVVGFMSHLILDEIWSIEWHRGRIRLKSSFGTAIKFWGDSVWANLSTYIKVIILTFMVMNDPEWMESHGTWKQEKQQIAERFLNRFGMRRGTAESNTGNSSTAESSTASNARPPAPPLPSVSIPTGGTGNNTAWPTAAWPASNSQPVPPTRPASFTPSPQPGATFAPGGTGSYSHPATPPPQFNYEAQQSNYSPPPFAP